LAKTLVNTELVARVRTLMGDTSPRIFLVVAVEASGMNKIPRAAAAVLAAQLGLCADVGIGQRNSPQRTGMDEIDRLFSLPVFEGEVIRGQQYILLDDTVTQGGTFAALASHIQAFGGIVLGSVALTGKRYSAKI
jgi:adenine/guanine phosphoribosyltransferase-like PRPP-binding protein